MRAAEHAPCRHHQDVERDAKGLRVGCEWTASEPVYQADSGTMARCGCGRSRDVMTCEPERLQQ